MVIELSKVTLGCGHSKYIGTNEPSFGSPSSAFGISTLSIFPIKLVVHMIESIQTAWRIFTNTTSTTDD